jgi:hypothetical protein
MTPDQAKLYHETFKHLATLSTGSILVASALLSKADVPTRNSTIAGIVCMIIASVISIAMMFDMAAGKFNRVATEIVKFALIGLYGLALGFFGYVVLFRT